MIAATTITTTSFRHYQYYGTATTSIDRHEGALSDRDDEGAVVRLPLSGNTTATRNRGARM
jgi:hypothetical protein